MQTVLFGRDLAGTHSVLHAGGSGHWVFASNADAVEEQRPDVANNPTILSDTPRTHQHDETEEHDGGILNQAPPSTQPIPENTDQDLADNDTADLEILNGSDPRLAADRPIQRMFCGRSSPAIGKGSSKEGLEIADGKEYVAFQTETSTGENHVAQVIADGR